jgi:hypothetical protein
MRPRLKKVTIRALEKVMVRDVDEAAALKGVHADGFDRLPYDARDTEDQDTDPYHTCCCC